MDSERGRGREWRVRGKERGVESEREREREWRVRGKERGSGE